jgi:transposase
LVELLVKRPKVGVQLKASAESEWVVARGLEELGHEVVVGDSNFAPIYTTRSHRVRTDNRDARTLAKVCKLGTYRSAYRTSKVRRHMRAQLAVRKALIRMRTRYIALMGALIL